MRKFACFLALTLMLPAISGAFPSWTEVGIGSHDVDWTPGGSGTLAVAGTFGGATVTFFWCAPISGTPQCFEVDPTGGCTFTSPGFCDFFKGPGTLRLTVTGGTPLISAVAAGPTQASAGVAGGGGGVSGLLDGPITYGDSAGGLTQAADFVYDEVQGFVGIGTASPGAELDIVGRIQAAPLGLLNGENIVSVDAGTVTGGVSAFRATGSVSVDLDFLVQNSTGNSKFNAFSTGAGDSFVRLGNLSQDWALGVDQSDSNRFHITSAGNLGSNRHLTIDTAGNVSVGDGARFELPESTTPPSGTESASYWDPADDVFFIHDGTNYLALTPRLGGELDNITYVIDTAVAPNQDVHVSLFNSIGGVIDSVPHCYLTDDPGGIGKSADVPDAITPGANQFLTQIGTDLRSFFLGADTLGLVDLTFNEASGPAGDSYRLACLVDGLKFVSGIIIPKP